jgi:hypothetical protein
VVARKTLSCANEKEKGDQEMIQQELSRSV